MSTNVTPELEESTWPEWAVVLWRLILLLLREKIQFYFTNSPFLAFTLVQNRAGKVPLCTSSALSKRLYSTIWPFVQNRIITSSGLHSLSLSLLLSSLAPQPVSRGDPHDEGNCNNLLNAMATVVGVVTSIGSFRKRANFTFCQRGQDERRRGWQQRVSVWNKVRSKLVFAHSQGAGLLIIVGGAGGNFTND